jgi:hypothetical protein
MASSSSSAAEAKSEPQGAQYWVPKGSLLELAIQMKQDMEGITPFPGKFTRTDYLINMCFDAIGARGADALAQDLAPRPPAEWPWFLINQERMTLQHYARFVYTFTNMVYNPASQLKVSVDGEEKDDAMVVPSTLQYMANCFNWMHAHSDKLTRMLRDVDPDWDTNANTAFATMAKKVATDRVVYDAYLNRSVDAHVSKHLSPKASAEDRRLAERVRTSAVIASVLPLIHADAKTLKAEAKKAGISKFAMLILSLEFDDVARQYARMSDKEKKDAYTELKAKRDKEEDNNEMPNLDDSQ